MFWKNQFIVITCLPLSKIIKFVEQNVISKLLAANGLRANEGRETNALNFKPNTNLKEIFEPSN